MLVSPMHLTCARHLCTTAGPHTWVSHLCARLRWRGGGSGLGPPGSPPIGLAPARGLSAQPWSQLKTRPSVFSSGLDRWPTGHSRAESGSI